MRELRKVTNFVLEAWSIEIRPHALRCLQPPQSVAKNSDEFRRVEAAARRGSVRLRGVIAVEVVLQLLPAWQRSEKILQGQSFIGATIEMRNTITIEKLSEARWPGAWFEC